MEKVQLTQEEVDALGFAVKARLMSIEAGITYENRHELETDSEYLAPAFWSKSLTSGIEVYPMHGTPPPPTRPRRL